MISISLSLYTLYFSVDFIKLNIHSKREGKNELPEIYFFKITLELATLYKENINSGRIKITKIITEFK